MRSFTEFHTTLPSCPELDSTEDAITVEGMAISEEGINDEGINGGCYGLMSPTLKKV